MDCDNVLNDILRDWEYYKNDITADGNYYATVTSVDREELYQSEILFLKISTMETLIIIQKTNGY